MKKQGFTLIELLVVISIIALLIGILLPALAQGRSTARQSICGSNARQMALAMTLYTHDNNGRFFPEKEATADGTLWWFGLQDASSPTTEGDKTLDRTQGRLWRYYNATDTIEICPSFPIESPYYKPKFVTNWTTYGPPLPLINPNMPAHIDQIKQTSKTLAFADTAQVNRFQAPASFANPMLEQWHYVTRVGNFVHYVHQETATASFIDGHVDQLTADTAMDTAIAGSPTGRPPSSVLLEP